MEIQKYWPLPLLLMVLMLTACASTGGSQSSGDPDIITRKQIQATSYTNAYALVQALKPMWLRDNSQMSINSYSYIVVYRDGIRLGGTGALRNINTTHISSIEFLNGVEASSRFGLNNQKGAIVVTTM